MALTPQENAFVSQLKKEGKSKEEAAQSLKKMREGGNPFMNFFQGVGKETYNIGSQLSRLAPGNQSADPTSFYSRAQRDMKGADIERARAGYNPEAFSSKAGEFTMDIAATAPLSMGFGALARGAVGVGAKVLPKVASKALPFVTASKGVGNMAKFGAFEGAKDTAAYDFLTKGETSLGNVAMGTVGGALLGPAIYGAGKLIGGVPGAVSSAKGKINTSKVGAYSEVLTSTLPKKIVANDLGFNPLQIEKFQKINNIAPEEYILKNNLATKSKKELLDHFNDLFTKSYTQKSNLLKPIGQRYRNPDVDEMLTKVRSYVEKNAEKMRDAEYAAKIGKIDELLKNKTYNLSEIKDTIREFDNWLSLFDAQGRVTGTGANKSLASLRDDVTDFLTNKAKNFGIDMSVINKDIRTSQLMRESLIRKIIKEDKNNMLGLQDLLLGNLLAGGDPFTGLSATLAKKGIESILPSIAQKIYKPSNVKAPISSTISRTASNSTPDSIFTTGMDRLRSVGKEVEALPPPSGLATQKRVKVPTSTPSVITGQKPGTKGTMGEITSRSKIVKPGTYTETPKTAPKATPKLKTNADVLPKKPIAKKQETLPKVEYTPYDKGVTPGESVPLSQYVKDTEIPQAKQSDFIDREAYIKSMSEDIERISMNSGVKNKLIESHGEGMGDIYDAVVKMDMYGYEDAASIYNKGKDKYGQIIPMNKTEKNIISTLSDKELINSTFDDYSADDLVEFIRDYRNNNTNYKKYYAAFKQKYGTTPSKAESELKNYYKTGEIGKKVKPTLPKKDLTPKKALPLSQKTPVKYGKVDELDGLSYTTSVDKKVYRGEGKGIGNATLVKGQYFADSKEFASEFGNVKEYIIPKGSKVFDLDKVKNGGVIPDKIMVDNEALTKYLIDNGFDYTRNTNTRGVEFVKLNKTLNELKTLASKSKDLADFKQKVMANYDKYREEIARLSKNYTNADISRLRSPMQDIWETINKK